MLRQADPHYRVIIRRRSLVMGPLRYWSGGEAIKRYCLILYAFRVHVKYMISLSLKHGQTQTIGKWCCVILSFKKTMITAISNGRFAQPLVYR